MKLLLLLALACGLLDGVPEPEAQKARPILKEALEQLETRFLTYQGFVPTVTDSYSQALDKLRAARTAQWPQWREELARYPDELRQLPGFAVRLATTSITPTESGYYNLTVADLKNVHKRAPLVWTDADRQLLLGEGLLRPTELAYGWDATADNWFFFMRTELELAGARQVADRLKALQPLKEHWFQRQVEVYQALRGAFSE